MRDDFCKTKSKKSIQLRQLGCVFEEVFSILPLSYYQKSGYQKFREVPPPAHSNNEQKMLKNTARILPNQFKTMIFNKYCLCLMKSMKGPSKQNSSKFAIFLKILVFRANSTPLLLGLTNIVKNNE